MNITDDQEDLQNTVNKENGDVKTFYTNNTEDKTPVANSITKHWSKYNENYTSESNIYDEKVHGFDTYPETLEDIKKRISKMSMNSISKALNKSGKEVKLEKGKKETGNKVDYGEIDWDYIDSMALRMKENTKYPSENWKKPMDIKELAKSVIRHARKILQPIEGDEETLEEHAVALGCNGFMINYQLKNQK